MSASACWRWRRWSATSRSQPVGGRITTVAEEQLTTSLAPIVGARVRTLRWLTLGAVFRGESKSTYDIEITNSLGAHSAA